jgi:hypothetical protein
VARLGPFAVVLNRQGDAPAGVRRVAQLHPDDVVRHRIRGHAQHQRRRGDKGTIIPHG